MSDVYEMNHINCGNENQMKTDPRSCERSYMQLRKKPEKNSGLKRGLNP